MRSGWVFLLLLIIFASCRDPEKPSYSLVISNVNLIDGTGSEIQQNVNVYVLDGKIHAINSNPITQSENVVEGTGKYLLPGLFDCHVHTTDFKNDFPRLVHYGVTSVFIPGGSTCTNEEYAAMRALGNQDSLPAPYVFHTSQHFSMEGRHPSKTYRSSNWRDGETIFYLKDTAQITKLVEQVVPYPISGIKLTIEDGPAPPFVERIPQEFIHKTVKEASKYQLEVFAHVSDNEELKMAVEGGVQNLLHYTGVNIDLENEEHLSWVRQLKARNCSWVTTLMIDKSFLYPVHPEWFDNTALLPEYIDLKNTLTPDLVERANIYLEILKNEYDVDQAAVSTFINPQVKDIKFLSESGINMVLGTDAGNDFNFPGYSLHEEMELLESGGIAPLEIIKMGTLNAARMLHAEDSLGSIEVGKIANMVLLDENPLIDIRNTLSINGVYKSGKLQTHLK